MTAPNPADRVPKIKRPRQMEAGLREGDMLRWPWSGYDGVAIEGRHSKTGEPIWMPAHRDLRAVLDALPRVSPVIVCNRRGTPYTQNGFLSSWRKLRLRLEAEGKVGKGLTIHGLRHLVATTLADAGAEDGTIMAITGHTDESMVKRYTERADRRKRATAAMRLPKGGEG